MPRRAPLSRAALFLAPLPQHKGRLARVGRRDRARRGARLRGAAHQPVGAERVLAGGALALRRGRSGRSAARAPASTRRSIRASRACRRWRWRARCWKSTRALPGRREPLRVLGLDVFRAALVQPELVATAPRDSLDLLRPDAIFLQSGGGRLAGREGRATGSPLQVGLAEVTLARGRASCAAAGARLGGWTSPAAQAALDRLGSINRIDLRLRPGVDVERVARAAAGRVAAGVLSSSGRRPTWSATPSLSRAYRVNLNVLALVALFTGGFLVFSAQALSVVRRRAQLALLRVLGVTRGGWCAMLLGRRRADRRGRRGARARRSAMLIAAAMLARFGADLGAGQFPRPASGAACRALGERAVFRRSASLVAARRQPGAGAGGGARRAGAGAEGGRRADALFARLRPAWPGLALIAGWARCARRCRRSAACRCSAISRSR